MINDNARTPRRAARVAIPAVAVCVAIAIARPGAYGAALAGIESAVTCATTAACVVGTNTGSGPGVAGTSKSGYGLQGTSTSNDGVKASSTSSNGVSATSNSLYGVKGVSSSSYGVYGLTSSGQAGVFGGTTSTDATAIGVSGNAQNGYGVNGYSYHGYGVNADTNDGIGLKAGSEYNLAILALSSDYSVQAIEGGAMGGGAYLSGSDYGVIADADGGYPLSLSNSGTTVLDVDYQGNIQTNGKVKSLVHARDGSTVQAYSAQTTVPTVEDTGTARLARGVATVTFDRAFAMSIDTSAPYRVFVTPNGDTHGVYVASKSASGFVVRENESGRSSVTFDYRIVASAPGQATTRMSFVDPKLMLHGPKRPATLPHFGRAFSHPASRPRPPR